MSSIKVAVKGWSPSKSRYTGRDFSFLISLASLCASLNA